MKKSIVISIPEPCHEDWAKMTATEKGKFCGVCTKEVFDFTSKTDEELVKILSKNKNACGKLNKSQLNREVKLERKSGSSFAPFAASMLLPLTLFSNNPEPSKNSNSEKPMVSLGIGRFSKSIDRIQIVTEGVVQDKYGNPLRNVEITSNETEAREWTNKNGEFKIVTLDHERLLFTIEKYDIKEIKLGNTSININVLMDNEVKYQTAILGKIAAEPQQPKQHDSIVITKGVVSDDTGLPLPGANVIIKGTSTGTQTDFDGNYSIKTKPGDVLVFSYVGFGNKEATISNISNLIDVNMEMDTVSGEMTVMAGGISYEEYQPPKDDTWKKKVKQSYKNTLAFMKIKQERRKAARKAKRRPK